MTHRSLTLGLFAAALLVTSPAAAQVPSVPVPAVPPAAPSPGDVVSQVPTDAVPGGTGAVTGAVGDAGGVLSGVDPGVLGGLGGTLDGVLGGSGVPSVPGVVPGAPAANPLGALLGTLPPRSAPGAVGTVGGPGVVPGTTTIDARPPVIKVTVLSLLRRTGRTGRLQLSVSSDEPAVAALSGTITPGKPRKPAFRARGFSKAIGVPAAVLVFRKAGALKVTVAVARGAQQRLNRARDARLTLAVIASDVVGNHTSAKLLRHVKR